MEVPVTITPAAQNQLDALPIGIHHRVLEILERLERWPSVSGAKPLRKELKGNWRIRTGDYRLIFRVTDDLVTVWKIDNRRDVYE